MHDLLYQESADQKRSDAVQIVYKRGREVVGIKHIGSAHNKTELDILLIRAKEVKSAGQLRARLVWR